MKTLLTAVLLSAATQAKALSFDELMQKAEQGDTQAQFAVAVHYETGMGVDAKDPSLPSLDKNAVDYVKAMYWFRKAADKGDAMAQYSIGMMYQHGEGVSKDYAEAMRWFQRSAKHYVVAEGEICVMYYDGRGVTQDYAEAAACFQRAADHGYPPAQSMLGEMYYSGKGVPRNLVMAHAWYNIAASVGGDAGDRQRRDSIAAEMTTQQVAAAQEYAREWKPVTQDCDSIFCQVHK